ncbi:unnamed protein product, partial [Heterosigma akashiwo]
GANTVVNRHIHHQLETSWTAYAYSSRRGEACFLSPAAWSHHVHFISLMMMPSHCRSSSSNACTAELNHQCSELKTIIRLATDDRAVTTMNISIHFFFFFLTLMSLTWSKSGT